MTIPAITLPMSPRSGAPRPMFSSLAIASSGLSAQRMRMDVIAQNLANAETTRTPDGGPYRRRVVELEAIQPANGMVSASILPPPPPVPFTTPSMAPTLPTAPTVAGALADTAASTAQALAAATGPGATGMSSTVSPAIADVSGGVRVSGIAVDNTDGPLIYNPGSPDADKNGYVRMPNVNIADEMMDLMNSRRVYEANATVFQVARAMLHKAIDI